MPSWNSRLNGRRGRAFYYSTPANEARRRRRPRLKPPLRYKCRRSHRRLLIRRRKRLPGFSASSWREAPPLPVFAPSDSAGTSNSCLSSLERRSRMLQPGRSKYRSEECSRPTRRQSLPRANAGNGARVQAYPGRRELSRHEETTGCVFENSLGLLSDDPGKPCEELFQPGARFEVLEQRCDRHPRTTEDPNAAHPIFVTFNGGTLRPVEHSFIIPKPRRGPPPPSHPVTRHSQLRETLRRGGAPRRGYRATAGSAPRGWRGAGRRSFLSTDRRRMICAFEAADAEAVRTAYRSAGEAFDRVWVAGGGLRARRVAPSPGAVPEYGSRTLRRERAEPSCNWHHVSGPGRAPTRYRPAPAARGSSSRPRPASGPPSWRR